MGATQDPEYYRMCPYMSEPISERQGRPEQGEKKKKEKKKIIYKPKESSGICGHDQASPLPEDGLCLIELPILRARGYLSCSWVPLQIPG